MRLTFRQLEAHVRVAASIPHAKTAGQAYKNYTLSCGFQAMLCDQWEWETDDAIAEQDRRR